jgi:hypothetical protein
MKIAKHKWLTCEEDMFVHVIPEEDIKPHGIKLTDTEYELSYICACSPKIESVTRKGVELRKPIVIHNSFEQDKFLDEIISNKLA